MYPPLPDTVGDIVDSDTVVVVFSQYWPLSIPIRSEDRFDAPIVFKLRQPAQACGGVSDGAAISLIKLYPLILDLRLQVLDSCLFRPAHYGVQSAGVS